MLDVSIIMPCRHQERHLPHAVESVLEQQQDGVELFVVDGASTDKTPDRLRQYEQRLRWISEEDQGHAEAFNKGLQATSGEIIGWLNADDAYLPDTIAKARQFLSENPDVDVVYGGLQQIDDQGEVLKTVAAEPWSFNALRHDCIVHAPSVFFRRRVVDRCGNLDTRFHYWADYEYWLRLASGGAKFASLPSLVARRRRHPDGRRHGTTCHRHRAASFEEVNSLIAAARGCIGSRKILYYANAKANAEGFSRDAGGGYDRAVLRHAMDGHRRWNGNTSQFTYSRRVLSILCRHTGKEFDSLVRHPHLASRFMPRPFKNFIEMYLRRKIFKLKIHDPRPLSLPEYYMRPAKLAHPPLISVVTPNLNQGEYIEDTINSVTGQGYPRLEYIIQDGGSSDNSVEVIRRHEKDLARWDSSPDRGQAHAINRGMQHTSGEIMAFLNSDDLLIPGSLAYVADFFQQNPGVDVVYGHRILINEQGEEIGRWVLPPHDDRVLPWADYIPQETMFWRRSAWEKVGGLDETFHFALDWDLILRFQAAGLRFVRLPRFLGAFRVTEVQKTSRLVETVGTREMTRLRQRVLGREPSKREIRRVLRPYMWRHLVCDAMYSLGVARY